MSRSHARAGAFLTSLLITAFASLLASPGAQADAADRKPDSAAVLALFTALDAAWNAREPERFSLLFTPESSLGFVGRELYLNGRPAILEQFQEQFPRTAPEYSHSTQVREIREIVPDVRAVDGTVRILRSRPGDEPPAVFRTFAITAIVAKAGDGWRIRLLRAYKLSDEEAADH